MSRNDATEARLRRLGERPAPGERDALQRSWDVLGAAYGERPAAPRRARPLVVRLAVVAALAVLALAVALSPAGAKVGEWLGDRFASEDENVPPAFAALPPGAEVLAVSESGAWIVRRNGVRRVGPFSEAGWSPHGLHVIGVHGRRLVAADPAGTVKWALTRPRPLHHPAWSPGTGFRVAYLAGPALRVVVGNGTGDRLVRRGAAPVTPAWRPGRRYVVSYARAGGPIETVDVDSGRRLWIRRAAGAPTALAWTRDGRRLVVLSEPGLRVYDHRGRPVLRRRLPGAGALAVHPGGRQAAVTVPSRAGTRVLAVPLTENGRPRRLFAGFGRVDGLDWSPDGRRLLLSWRDADQWLLLGPGRRVRALAGVSAELGAGAGFPRLAGWCCRG